MIPKTTRVSYGTSKKSRALLSDTWKNGSSIWSSPSMNTECRRPQEEEIRAITGLLAKELRDTPKPITTTTTASKKPPHMRYRQNPCWGSISPWLTWYRPHSRLCWESWRRFSCRCRTGIWRRCLARRCPLPRMEIFMQIRPWLCQTGVGWWKLRRRWGSMLLSILGTGSCTRR